MEKKFLKLELKADESGTVVGRASVYGIVDAGGDMVMPGAFSQHIRESGNTVKFLAQHNATDVIGLATIQEKADGLHFVAKLALELPSAKDMHTRLKHGLIDGISIGYEIMPGGVRSNRAVRELHSLRLWEISAVTFPMNTEARVTSVKQRDDEINAVLDALAQNIKAWKDEIAVKDTVQMLFSLARAERAISRINDELSKG